MATDVDQAYYDWSQEECDGDEHQETSVSHLLDHGSISFGRFASETLSWERRSVFTHDRRQEELDQFNGLVAKKKAYFEERYRRLRALKASQQSQQTELSLDYDGEGSNSSQSRAEEEKIPEHESVEVDVENCVHAPFVEDRTEPYFDQTISYSEDLQRNELHSESTFLDITSSDLSLENVVQDSKDNNTVQSQPLETEFSSLRENIEGNEVKESISLGSKGIIGEQENLDSSVHPKPSTHDSTMKTRSSVVSQLQPIKKTQGNKSALKAKNSASGIQRSRTPKQETRSDVVQQSKGIKNASKRMVGRAESSHFLRKMTINGVNNNNRSIMVASNKPLTETQPKNNTPGPFTLVMERRASNRGSEVKLDSRPPSRKSALPHTNPNSGSRVQDMSRKTTGVKNTRGSGSDNRRVLTEEKKKTFLSDNQTSLKRMQAPLFQAPLLPSKTSLYLEHRSLNLPARMKYDSNSRTAIQPTSIKENNQKKRTEDRRTPGITTKTPVSFMTALTKIAAKAPQIQNSELQTGRKQRPNILSHEGKCRQETLKRR